MTSRQLVFDLAGDPCFAADDFLGSPSNAAAVAAVKSWPDWPDRTLLLVGPPGAGKSHLGAIWATRAGAVTIPAGSPLHASIWHGDGRSVLLDDCDRPAFSEANLFHALNLVNETRGWLLITARSTPQMWGLSMPDLLSRLRRSSLAQIEPPEPELIKAVLVKLFADRQIRIDEEVISYAAKHCERSLEAVSRFVATVDEDSLATGRKITRPMATAILAALNNTSSD